MFPALLREEDIEDRRMMVRTPPEAGPAERHFHW